MKISIPQEYQDHFPRETMWLNLKDRKHCTTKEYQKVFMVRWRDNALLFLNETEHNRLKEGLGRVANGGVERFIEAGIQTAVMTNGEIEVPEYLHTWLQGTVRKFSKAETGLLLR